MHPKDFRKALGLTLRQVADATGLAPSTVMRLENGDHLPGFNTQKRYEAWAFPIAKQKRLRLPTWDHLTVEAG